MDTTIELKRKRAAQLDKARSILDGVEEREDAKMTEDDEANYKRHMDEAKRLGDMIQRREELEREAGAYVASEDDGPLTTRGTDKMHAPNYHQRPTADNANSIFLRFVRTGDEGAQRESNAAVAAEYRASNDTTMNITTAADGGDLVPTGHYQGIIERARPMDLTSQLGLMNIPGRGTSVDVPIDNEADSGVFVSTSESGEFDRDAPAVSKVTMTLVMYTKRLDLTYQILQDEDSRLMEFLNSYVGSGYAATLNSLMITEALADGTAGLTLDAAAAIGPAEIPELAYKLSAEYARGNVAWLMDRATEGYLRGLRSTSDFDFGITPGPATGNGSSVQSTLWGYPLYTDSNMPDLSGGNKSMIIGNWGYMGKRIDPVMTFLRDPYTRSSYGEVRLNYYFRADFEVLQAGAFQYATHPTA